MEFNGIDIERIEFSWISAAEAIKWTEVIDKFTDKVRELGRHSQYNDDIVDPYAQFLVQKDQESA